MMKRPWSLLARPLSFVVNAWARFSSGEGKLAPVRETAIVVGAYFTYMFVRKVIVPDASGIGLDNAVSVINAEKSLGIFWEPQLQSWFAGVGDGALLFFNYLYIFTFFPIVLSSAAILYMVNRKRYLYYRGMILLSFAAALLFFAAYPLAPPRFMEFTGIIDSIVVHGPAWYSSRDAAVFYNEYAAMPSLHFSWTLLWGFVYWRSGPRILKVLGVLYPTATFFAIVVTGNHYMLDAVGGAGMMVVVFFLYRYLLSGRLSRPPTAPAREALG